MKLVESLRKRFCGDRYAWPNLVLFFTLVALHSSLTFATDTTPPAKPIVIDDGIYTTDSTSLHATWTSSDLESGIAEYQYHIRQDSTSGPIIVGWTSVGLATEITRTGLSLINGKRHYFGVMAKNGEGLWSLVGYSNGIKVDTSPPSAPGQAKEGSSTSDRDYDADGNYAIYWSAAADSESGISSYELQEKVSTTGTWATLAITSARKFSVRGRLHSIQYFYRVRAKNGAGLWGPWSLTSDGVLVDKTAPSGVTVMDDGASSSTAKIHATWSASSDPESGIVDYQYLIREDSTSGPIIVNWTSVGLATEVTRTDLNLLYGGTYFVGVRARNGARVYSSPSYSDGITFEPEPIPRPIPSTPYEGFGAQTPGGAGQPVYRVTNLNDSGPGSLRDAVSEGYRYVVFDVGGVIALQRNLFVQGPFITIDGFTAPSPGITLKNFGLVLRNESVDGKPGGAHDVILRGLRVRNAAATESTDCIQIAYGAYNIVVDHSSMSGCGDGTTDVTTGAYNVTLSWNIFAEPISQEKTMLIKYNPSRISLLHNLFVKGKTRNPQISREDDPPATDTTVDMRNNVIWDWGGGYGTLVRYGPRVNIVNNLYANPSGAPGDKRQALIVCKGDGIETPDSLALCANGAPATASRGYVAGNVSLDGMDLDAAGNEPSEFPAPFIETQDACAAARRVIAEAGVPFLDFIDQQYLALISPAPCSGS